MPMSTPAIAPLYVQRKLLNACDVLTWATLQGLPSILEPSELHVTICLSPTPLDWTKTPKAPNTLTVPADQNRKVEPIGLLGSQALKFHSPELTQRWQQLLDAGASWPYSDYQPHLTLTYYSDPLFDYTTISPYNGPLKLGPEIFQHLNPAYSDTAPTITL